VNESRSAVHPVALSVVFDKAPHGTLHAVGATEPHRRSKSTRNQASTQAQAPALRCMPKARRQHGLRAIAAARKALAAQSVAGHDPRRSVAVNRARGEAISEGHRRNRSWAREHPRQREEAWFKRQIATEARRIFSAGDRDGNGLVARSLFSHSIRSDGAASTALEQLARASRGRELRVPAEHPNRRCILASGE
jgi:hypothetical protein